VSAITILSNFILLLALLVLPGQTYAVEKGKTVEPEKKQQTQPVPEVKKKDTYYEYSGIGRRDPFTSLIQKKSNEKVKGAAALEAYDTSEMKLIAVLWEKKKYYAVLALPDGKAYTVFENDKVGKSSGFVKQITNDMIIISEKVKDARGRISPKDSVLKLRSEEE
jgi:Tfp pilus assembly protein PilP